MVRAPALASRNFILVCTTSLGGYLGNWMVLPVLPLFLAGQGYSETFIGLVLAAYNVSSFSARPVFGRLVDRGRPRSALIASCGLLAISSLGYTVPSTAFLFAVRAAHGLGWAGLNAVGTAWIATLAPITRRAEAMGYYTMFQSLGTAVAPAIGIGLLAAYGAGAAFGVSALCGLAAFVSAVFTLAPRRAPRTEEQPADVNTAAQRGSWLAGIVEPSVVGAMLLLTVVQLNQPVVSSFAPLYFKSIGASGIEWYYAGQGLVSILSRALLGGWADRVGRQRSMLIGFSIQLVGLVVLGQFQQFPLLIAGGALYTLGSGIAQPSMYATAADRSDPPRRGAAMATYTMGFQLGSGLGAVLWGVTIDHFGYHVMYIGCLIPVAAAMLMTWRDSAQKRVPAAG